MTTTKITAEIDVEVDHHGVITFFGEDGDICCVTVHPKDLKDLLMFLTKQAYAKVSTSTRVVEKDVDDE